MREYYIARLYYYNLIKEKTMLKKHFIVLGLFLVVGFLFLNINSASAAYFWWDGGGDGVTWTDPLNWGANSSYPGASVTDQVVIATSTAGGNVTVRATSTLAGSLEYLQLGYNAGGYKSGATLILGKEATIAASSSIILMGTSTLKLGDESWGSGTVIFATSSANAIPFKLSTTTADAFFYAATGTVKFTGTGGGIVVATTSYYNLTFTPTSTTALSTYIFSMKSGSSTCFSTNGCTATTTITNVLTLNASSSVDFNSNAVILSGSGTVFEKANGAFVANGSLVKYTSASATNIATGTYDNLVISEAATKTLLGNTTATSTVTVASGSTLAISTYTFTATGSTWTNSGTVTEGTGGKITLAAAGVISDSAGGSAVATFGNVDTSPMVHIQITDTSLNLLAASAETRTITVTAVSGISTSQSVTLTETTVTSGIFRGSLPFTLSGTAVSGLLAYQGNGTASYSFTDPQDSSDIVTGSATFTGTAPGGGGSGSSSSGGTTATTVTQTTTTTTVAPTAETTITTTTTTAPATAAVPTLTSVQTKIANVVAKMATLSANPASSELADVQAQIAAILADIQAIQTTTATPQGAALGYTFVRPLALGMSHNDVSNLQTALKTDPSVYPGGKVTGYFGPATLLAIKKFQEKYSIASEGQPGYGNVGPKTRVKLNELYGK